MSLNQLFSFVQSINSISKSLRVPINRPMHEERDLHPRLCQNVTARLIERVIIPSLAILPTHDLEIIGGARTQDEFLDRAQKGFDNAAAADARGAFVLTLAAMFERHLRRWLFRSRMLKAGTLAFEVVLDVGLARLPDQSDVPVLRQILLELVLVGNVLRHGNGRSVAALREGSPDLWHDLTLEDHDWVEESYLHAETMRIGEDRIRKYASAIIRFWGIADTLPDAVRDRGY